MVGVRLSDASDGGACFHAKLHCINAPDIHGCESCGAGSAAGIVEALCALSSNDPPSPSAGSVARRNPTPDGKTNKLPITCHGRAPRPTPHHSLNTFASRAAGRSLIQFDQKFSVRRRQDERRNIQLRRPRVRPDHAAIGTTPPFCFFSIARAKASRSFSFESRRG